MNFVPRPFTLKNLYTIVNTCLHVNYVNNSLLCVHDLTVSKLSEGMEYFRSIGNQSLSEGIGGWIPVIKNNTGTDDEDKARNNNGQWFD